MFFFFALDFLNCNTYDYAVIRFYNVILNCIKTSPRIKTNLHLILKKHRKIYLESFICPQKFIKEINRFTHMHIRNRIKYCSNNSFVYFLDKIRMHSENHLALIIKDIQK